LDDSGVPPFKKASICLNGIEVKKYRSTEHPRCHPL
jgi:hypothetical protein